MKSKGFSSVIMLLALGIMTVGQVVPRLPVNTAASGGNRTGGGGNATGTPRPAVLGGNATGGNNRPAPVPVW